MTELPATVLAETAAIARDTLGGAVDVATELPLDLATVVLAVAREGFVDGMQVTAGIGAVGAIGVAVLAIVTLRDVGAGGDHEGAIESPAAATGESEVIAA